jgi:hypothetical protein
MAARNTNARTTALRFARIPCGTGTLQSSAHHTPPIWLNGSGRRSWPSGEMLRPVLTSEPKRMAAAIEGALSTTKTTAPIAPVTATAPRGRRPRSRSAKTIAVAPKTAE